jgi:hypothetical protein
MPSLHFGYSPVDWLDDHEHSIISKSPTREVFAITLL